ncbi:phosphatidylinositol 4,5-bisphosphate 3-kinase catalytic subunit beta isoform-like isoform X2 [Amphiura filiformis]|uniref:phosphatidylinositol 4,5-bisphosphate 3-kinase catalytic subunit beta isoform-like isoform X2 n=1 Tax=Amphiura filiformis TaxID=82378 RepID=UPI003B211686
MPPGGHLYNIWEQEGVVDDKIDVSCLLPTGILILLRCSRQQTITSIKTEVWKQAKTFPFFNQLLDINYYVFQCINQNAEQEELLDEKRRLCDVQPFSPDLKVVLKADDVEDKVLNGNISHLIDKGLHEFDMMHNEEVNDYRMKMQHESDSIHRKRSKWDWEKKACFLFPPHIESSLATGTLKRQLHAKKSIPVSVKFMDNPLRKTVVIANLQELPSELIKKAFTAVRLLKEKNEKDYVLKLRGRQDFLIGNRPLHEYKYIRDMITQGGNEKIAEVVIVHKETLQVNELIMDPLLKRRKDIRPPPTPVKRAADAFLSCDVHDQVRITIHKAWNVNVDSSANTVVRVRAAIFHGGEQLGDSFITTTETSGTNPSWNEWFDAKLTVSNLPRMARLCMLIGTTRKNTTKNFLPLAWVNTTFFNFKNQLQTGSRILHMWPDLEGDDFKALGTVESNPGHRAEYNSTAIEISFDNNSQNHTVVYPPLDTILKRAKEIEESEHAVYLDQGDLTDNLRKIVEKDPLERLNMQEMEKLWKAREECLEHIPHSLPRLLQCVQWDNSSSVAQMQGLLQNWPELKPEEAMELLDYRYADKNVRKFAVMCLEKLTDEELSQYLLQLVQALKYETHLDCDLGNFLLTRAVQNQRIGHFFFWHLRAEMHVLSASTRFGLLLEAYCRCNIAHMRTLKKQVENLNKMASVNEVVKRLIGQDKSIQDQIATLREMLHQYMFAGSFKQFLSPLSPSYYLREPRVESCRVMGSKMAPLFLVFKNEDALGQDVMILYKNGDDLRQDMLTLQVLQIMDNIWKKEGLDLRLIPYRALATGDCSGFIQIVTQAETISKIQVNRAKARGRGKLGAAFHSSSLFEWLKEKNVTGTELDHAIEDFTYSCAGYCVATYVLGIGDRHNDNIMVKETGQLFHIDFGHFLGKFKSKFGVKRERVPFVLTHDFVHVITRGDKKGTKSSKQAFQNFQNLCEQAFLILRRYGNLLITLFAMMLSSGIPELSDSTIGYLRGSLVLDMSEDDAVKHFRAKFKAALQDSWKTSVNWSFHNIARG